MSRPRLGALGALLAASSGGCPPALELEAPIPIQWWGCEAMSAPYVCELPPQGAPSEALVAWVAGPGRFRAALGGEALEIRASPVDGGTRIQLPLPERLEPAATLTLRSGSARWRLRLVGPKDASAKRDPSRAYARARSREARRRLRAGDVDAAVALFDEARVEHALRGDWSRAVRDAQAAAFALIHSDRERAEAVARLDWADAQLQGRSEEWMLQPYYRALLARAEGRLVDALRDLSEASLRAERVAAAGRRALVDELAASVALRLGWADEARRRLDRLPPPPADHPCEHAFHLDRRAWAELLFIEVSSPDAPTSRARAREVLDRLDAALALLDGPAAEALGCAAGGRVTIVRLHRALALLLAEELEAAARALDGLGGPGPRLEVDVWRAEVEGRIALSGGRLDRAVHAFERMRDVSLRTVDPDLEWRSHLWLGRALRAAGDRAAAEEAFRASERALDAATASLRLAEGRLSFLSHRRAAADALADLALERGDVEAAFCTLRRAQRRGLFRAALLADQGRWAPSLRAPALRVAQLRSELEAREAAAWGLDAAGRRAAEEAWAAIREDLRKALREAVLTAERAASRLHIGSESACPRPTRGRLLGVFRVPRGPGLERPGWWAFLDDGEAVEVEARSVPWGSWLGSWLSAKGALAGAAPLVVVADEVAAQAGLHAASVAGRPLAARVPLAFTLDLEPRDPKRSRAPERWVVVGDPTGTLRGAPAEAHAVRDRLVAKGADVVVLEGPAIERAAFGEALREADGLHFAGHVSTGPEAWEDAIELGDERWTVADVLNSPSPRRVILTACRASGLGLGAPRLSVTHAFLLAGAEVVLSAVGEVDDEVAALVGRALHSGRSEDTLSERFLTLAARTASTSWAPFRVVIRSVENGG